MRDLVGQQIGNYRLVRLLGRGGYADVYLGEHRRLSMSAAIKVLQRHLSSEEDIRNFQQEAQIIADLIHPHIVRMLDFDIWEGLPFLVLDYAPNGSLRLRHGKSTRLPLSLVVSYVTQIASALQYAHERKLIHRDVKPENMLLGRQNEVLLSDFGIATIAHSTLSMSAQTSIGTIFYMAPEQIQSYPRTSSDQYSLGVVVYSWLCGAPLFQGSYAEIVAKHLTVSPPPLRKLVPEIPPEVERVVLTALAKDPKQRFGTIQEFALALERAAVDAYPKIMTGKFASVVLPRVAPAPNPPVAVMDGLKGAMPAQGSMASGAQKTPQELLRPLPLYNYVEHVETVRSVAWSPDGKYIASAGDDGTVHIWDAANGRNVLIYGQIGNPQRSAVWSVAWSPDSQRIAIACIDGTVRLYDATAGTYIMTYRNHLEQVFAIAWSPDGRYMASASADKTVHVWDAVSGKTIHIYSEHKDAVMAVAWSPDGRYMASSSADGTVRLWRARTGEDIFLYRRSNDVAYSVAWSPNSRYIALENDDHRLEIRERTGEPYVQCGGRHNDVIYAIAWSPNGKMLASASADRTVQIWNAGDGSQVATYAFHRKGVLSVAWSPNSQCIASASIDHTAHVWSLV